ncbi:MAG: hypothetical protein DRJ01_19055 [Bacteroidetes bacterium]|nr:MAG: hypothetical protein DRJ01_19055 [Bacteroidota bacterium]
MPNLYVIAGCNGSGKSTFAKSLIPKHVKSFDFNKTELAFYNQIEDSELRSKFAKDKAIKTFEDAIKTAISNKKDFCYETNFDIEPLYWPNKFKENGYTLNIIFFCIENQTIARDRIKVRIENKGHFVDNKTIDIKWKAGYKNINSYYNYFENILIIDNSNYNEKYTYILQIVKNKIELFSGYLPEYFPKRFPEIYKKINQ